MHYILYSKRYIQVRKRLQVYVAKKASIAQYKATKVHYNVVEAGHLYR